MTNARNGIDVISATAAAKGFQLVYEPTKMVRRSTELFLWHLHDTCLATKPLHFHSTVEVNDFLREQQSAIKKLKRA
jgi:hypothetical protein